MGMYTLMHCRVSLKADAPNDVIEALKNIIDNFDGEEVTYPDHDFFRCERFKSLFYCSSAYFPEREQGKPVFKKFNGAIGWEVLPDQYLLKISSSLKNYDGEIDKFVEWLGPHIDEGVIYSQYEEFEVPELKWPKIREK